MVIESGDLHSQAYFDDPFPVWEQLRHDQPLFHDTVDDRWLLTRYDDVAAVFRDHETYSTKPYERIFTDVIGPTMVQMDGDDHDVRRSIVAPVLVGQRLETNYLPLIDVPSCAGATAASSQPSWLRVPSDAVIVEQNIRTLGAERSETDGPQGHVLLSTGC